MAQGHRGTAPSPLLQPGGSENFACSRVILPALRIDTLDEAVSLQMLFQQLCCVLQLLPSSVLYQAVEHRLLQ